MSVKVIWQKHPNAQDEDPTQNGTKSETGTGTAFLLSKSEQISGNQRLIKEANEIATWLRGVIGSLVRDAASLSGPHIGWCWRLIVWLSGDRSMRIGWLCRGARGEAFSSFSDKRSVASL